MLNYCLKYIFYNLYYNYRLWLLELRKKWKSDRDLIEGQKEDLLEKKTMTFRWI